MRTLGGRKVGQRIFLMRQTKYNLYIKYICVIVAKTNTLIDIYFVLRSSLSVGEALI